MPTSDERAEAAMQKALETNDPADWEEAFRLAREADKKNGK
jgi:hypothetical protein